VDVEEALLLQLVGCGGPAAAAQRGSKDAEHGSSGVSAEKEKNPSSGFVLPEAPDVRCGLRTIACEKEGVRVNCVLVVVWSARALVGTWGGSDGASFAGFPLGRHRRAGGRRRRQRLLRRIVVETSQSTPVNETINHVRAPTLVLGPPRLALEGILDALAAAKPLPE